VPVRRVVATTRSAVLVRLEDGNDLWIERDDLLSPHPVLGDGGQRVLLVEHDAARALGLG
jgi:hypothetical protein